MRARRFLTLLVAVIGVIAGLCLTAPSASATDPDGWNSVGDAVIAARPEVDGYRVEISADAKFKPSVGLADTPDPAIYWGDGTWEKVSAHTDACDHLEFSCLWDTDAIQGAHVYYKSGNYEITLRYYTGFAIWYDATWRITIPRTTTTIKLATSGQGFGTIAYSPTPVNGGSVCPPDCAPRWQDATEVTLTAVPKVGSRFAKFERVNCGPFACRVSPCRASVNPCNITMRLDPTWSVDLRIWFDKTDLTRPDIFAYATTGDGEPYAAGSWTSQPVTVSYLCVDQHTDASGLESNSVAGATIDTEGADQSVTNSGSCVDHAANAALPVTFGPIHIDRTPPTITYAGNAGTYTADQMVAITCTASDPLSGVASSTCQDITGPAYSFLLSPGVNTFSATATDVAGNAMAAPASTNFTVTVNAAAIGSVITRLVTNDGVAASLTAESNAVASAPNATAKAGKLKAYINHVRAQTGKSITPDAAAVLITLAQSL